VGRALARDLAVVESLFTLFETNGGGTVKLYEPMANHTTIRIGGPAQYWIEPRTVAAFQQAVRYFRENSLPIRVVGRGSNLLVRDGGIRGAVIHPSRGEFEEVSITGTQLTAGAGARFKKIASAARQAGLSGFEWMEGIPGNLGGCLRMNAGAMGSQTFDQVVSVRLLNGSGEVVEKSKDEIIHHYRNVPELDHHYAVSAVLQGTPAQTKDIDAKMEHSHTHRKETQPIGASAGCIFKNPTAIPAGKLVDQLGYKGKGHGPAIVSQEHGNFILNSGGAKARDVLDLIADIRLQALQQRGVTLETEVQIIGEEQIIPL
jgi:UDP-N-acetylmuramate--alanine ligase